MKTELKSNWGHPENHLTCHFSITVTDAFSICFDILNITIFDIYLSIDIFAIVILNFCFNIEKENINNEEKNWEDEPIIKDFKKRKKGRTK